MGEKLVRNKTNKESRAWWEAVRSAAASAPKLTYELKAKSENNQSSAAPKTNRTGKKRS
jgi:hypothetical protein